MSYFSFRVVYPQELLADPSSNWDYRYSWVRDSSFTIYILLRMGFTSEADNYMNFISERFRKSRSADGALPIMFTIRGETNIPEIDLELVFPTPARKR